MASWNGRAIKNVGGRAFATVAGSVPGLIAPFTIAATYDTITSDRLFLLISASLLVVTLVMSSVEAGIVSSLGAAIASERGYSKPLHRRTILHAVGVAGLFNVTAFPLTIFVYSVSSSRPVFTGLELAVIWGWPFVAAICAVQNGVLIAAGRIAPTLLLLSLRSLPPLVMALVEAPPHILLGSFVAGEGLRLLVSARYRRSTVAFSAETDLTAMPTLRTLIPQAISIVTLQANPVIDRAFLGAAGGGAVTTYELADKIYFVANNITSQSVMLAWVRRWPLLIATSERASAVARIQDDLRRLLRVAGGVALAGFVGACVARVVVPDALLPRDVVKWSAILLLGLPFSLYASAGARWMLLAGRAWWLPRLALVGLLVNLTADGAFFIMFGGIGIPVATVVLRLSQAAIQAMLQDRLATATLRATSPNVDG